MNRDDIIRMAREAGLVYCVQDGWTSPTPECPHAEGVEQEPLARFAALVAAAEREACAKVCEEWFTPNLGSEATAAIAAAIRTRSNT